MATQTQLLVQKEAETEAKRAVSEAEKRAAVATIELGKQLAEKQSMQRVEAIENDMHLARQKVAPMNRNPDPDLNPNPNEARDEWRGLLFADISARSLF